MTDAPKGRGPVRAQTREDLVELLTLDLADWWHAYSTREPWTPDLQPLPLALDEAAAVFVEHALSHAGMGDGARDAEAAWIAEPRFAGFRQAYDYARSHFSRALGAFGKVTRSDAYLIHGCIQRGLDEQAREQGKTQISDK
jgi:hypothetical protein